MTQEKKTSFHSLTDLNIPIRLKRRPSVVGWRWRWRRGAGQPMLCNSLISSVLFGGELLRYSAVHYLHGERLQEIRACRARGLV